MTNSPNWKVFNPKGEYVASCKFPEDAAAIVAAYGDGASIRWGHAKKDTVFTEGENECRAGNSYDACGELCRTRKHLTIFAMPLMPNQRESAS